jgi:hypothetical protein
MAVYGLAFDGLEIISKKAIKKPQHKLGFCDLDWIQTSNLLSRNQVRYSVAPQGHCGCKDRHNLELRKYKY